MKIINEILSYFINFNHCIQITIVLLLTMEIITILSYFDEKNYNIY